MSELPPVHVVGVAPVAVNCTPEALLAGLAQGLMADAAALDAWIAEGEADLAAGRVVPFEAAMTEIDAIIDTARRRRS